MVGGCERERERERERDQIREEERWISFIFILLGSFYYFIRLYVNIRNKILGVLLNKLIK